MTFILIPDAGIPLITPQVQVLCSARGNGCLGYVIAEPPRPVRADSVPENLTDLNLPWWVESALRMQQWRLTGGRWTCRNH